MNSERFKGCGWLVIADFFVKTQPKAQPRARFSRKTGHVYNPDSADGWKNALAWQAKQFVPEKMIEGPVRVWLDFYFKRPCDLMGRKHPDEPIEHAKKPDRDNLDKAVLDVFKNLGFFVDDAQVCGGEIRKYYTAKPSYGQFIEPGCYVMIERKSDQ